MLIAEDVVIERGQTTTEAEIKISKKTRLG
jgi:hypothetical protein